MLRVVPPTLTTDGEVEGQMTLPPPLSPLDAKQTMPLDNAFAKIGSYDVWPENSLPPQLIDNAITFG
jgi:hypothetical protein